MATSFTKRTKPTTPIFVRPRYEYTWDEAVFTWDNANLTWDVSKPLTSWTQRTKP